jgi:phosphoribosylaminoimidazole (AIR) synthetase
MVHIVGGAAFLNGQITDRKKMSRVQISEESLSVFEWLLATAEVSRDQAMEFSPSYRFGCGMCLAIEFDMFMLIGVEVSVDNWAASHADDRY